jgi:hypothetical protein
MPVAAGSRLTFFARAKESKQINTPSVSQREEGNQDQDQKHIK